jgi:glycosyltransferase involved in cell wall biosynthesis
MRIALSALSVKPERTGGGETVLVHLMRALPRVDSEVEYLLFVTTENRALFVGVADSIELYVVPSWVEGVGVRVLYEMVWMPQVVQRWGADLFFAVNQVASPLFSCPVSSLVQNLLYYHYSELYPGRWRPGALVRRIFFRYLGRWSVRRARQVIAVSETARQVVTRCDGVEAIEVVPLASGGAIDPIVASQVEQVRDRVGAPFYIYVGALEPYKKIDRAIIALAHVRRRPETSRVRLVLIGMGGSGEALRVLAKEQGVEDGVEWVGPVPNREVGAWYAAAVGAVLLSTCEAFPLVPLEAMAQGTPVIASNRSAVPEVVGAGGMVVDPDDVQGVADVMYQMVIDEAFRQELVERARARAQVFSWERTAAELVRIWRAAVVEG